jgi:gas vesicle protein GvpL/GvpF
MSVLHVYALTDSPARPAAAGLHGAPLRWIESGPLAAVASEHAQAPEPEEDVLWAHEQVVEELMSAATVLPLRFGSRVEGPEALAAMLADRRQEFLASLARVRGAVEVSVRAELPAAGDDRPLRRPGPAGSGTAYLLERAERERGEREAVELVHRPLAALARSSAQPPAPPGSRQFKAAYLVDQGSLEAFGARVAELNAGLEGARVSCTGPWPPYSFVAESAA